MPDSLDIDADPFFTLLTDALRAGPGSPEWHEAVVKVKSGGVAHGDEYQLLVAARQHLESGKSYRGVRAGPGFARKVMTGIETTDPKPGVPTANLIAIIGAAVVIGVLALIGYWLLRGGSPAPMEDLSNVYFGTTAAQATFDGPLPAEWRLIGPLAVDPAKGLRPTTPQPPTSTADYAGGGVVTTGGIPANPPFAVEATFHFQYVTDDVIPQLFVTDHPDFSADRATSPHELVWLVRGGRARVVLPDGQIADSTEKVGGGQSLTVRLIVGPRSAQVVSGGHTLWAGSCRLADGPRYVGIRFLRCGPDKRNAVVAQSIKIMTK
jgi:hypothetical protein